MLLLLGYLSAGLLGHLRSLIGWLLGTLLHISGARRDLHVGGGLLLLLLVQVVVDQDLLGVTAGLPLDGGPLALCLVLRGGALLLLCTSQITEE